VVEGARHFNIWARVHIMAPATRFVAADDLRQGVPLQAKQLRVEAVEAFPQFSKAGASTVESMVGLLPTRAIAAGSEIRPELLTKPFDITRGDLVRVEVRLGQGRLVLNGRAETAGRMGDMIAIRNTDSSRIFQARVQGKGKVLVDPRSAGDD
jgi:flagella basal body P-ring formation protein FlgA